MYKIPNINFPYELYSFSALDRYLGMGESEVPLLAVTTADPADIARDADSIFFPGVPGIDAETRIDSGTILFRCEDDEAGGIHPRVPVLSFRYVPERGVFRDPDGVYYLLRERATGVDPGDGPFLGWIDLANIAVLMSRYAFSFPETCVGDRKDPAMPAYLQRLFLNFILTGKNPAAGLSFLLKSGFVAVHWPELFALDEIDHSKEYHPEGNVWKHTMETFSYRKTPDLRLGLALLLHDIGKIRAIENEGNRFDRHAQIGGDMSSSFLRKLGYTEDIIEDVRFLVSRHMMPAMISKLPVFRTEDTMRHPLFPLLLEVYRCDISSTFRGPEGYYKACKAYREFLKNRKNPYRTADGKKIFRMYVE